MDICLRLRDDGELNMDDIAKCLSRILIFHCVALFENVRVESMKRVIYQLNAPYIRAKKKAFLKKVIKGTVNQVIQ